MGRDIELPPWANAQQDLSAQMFKCTTGRLDLAEILHYSLLSRLTGHAMTVMLKLSLQ
jgi:hypothetical protein